MRVRNFIVADAVAQGLNGKFYVHGGGVTSIGALAFPWVQPTLGILVTLVYDSPEDDVEHQLEVLFEREGADVPLATLIQLNTDQPPDSFETRETWFLLHALGVVNGLNFDEPGRYWIVLRLDGVEYDRMVLDAARQPGAPEQQPPDGP